MGSITHGKRDHVGKSDHARKQGICTEPNGACVRERAQYFISIWLTPNGILNLRYTRKKHLKSDLTRQPSEIRCRKMFHSMYRPHLPRVINFLDGSIGLRSETIVELMQKSTIFRKIYFVYARAPQKFFVEAIKTKPPNLILTAF